MRLNICFDENLIALMQFGTFLSLLSDEGPKPASIRCIIWTNYAQFLSNIDYSMTHMQYRAQIVL